MSKLSYEISTVSYQFSFLFSYQFQSMEFSYTSSVHGIQLPVQSIWNSVTSSVHGIQLPVQSMEFSYQFSPWNSVISSVHGIQLPVQSMEFSYHFSDASSGWIQLSLSACASGFELPEEMGGVELGVSAY